VGEGLSCIKLDNPKESRTPERHRDKLGAGVWDGKRLSAVGCARVWRSFPGIVTAGYPEGVTQGVVNTIAEAWTTIATRRSIRRNMGIRSGEQSYLTPGGKQLMGVRWLGSLRSKTYR